MSLPFNCHTGVAIRATDHAPGLRSIHDMWERLKQSGDNIYPKVSPFLEPHADSLIILEPEACGKGFYFFHRGDKIASIVGCDLTCCPCFGEIGAYCLEAVKRNEALCLLHDVSADLQIRPFEVLLLPTRKHLHSDDPLVIALFLPLRRAGDRRPAARPVAREGRRAA